jgi:hypothetical protein
MVIFVCIVPKIDFSVIKVEKVKTIGRLFVVAFLAAVIYPHRFSKRQTFSRRIMIW